MALLKQLNVWCEALLEIFYALQWQEIGATLGSIALAFLVGGRLSRMVRSQPRRHWLMRLSAVFAPMLIPIFGLCFALTAMLGLRELGIDSALLLLTCKIMASWVGLEWVHRMVANRVSGWLIALTFIPLSILFLFGMLEHTITLLSELRFSFGSITINLYVVLKAILALMVLQWLTSLSINLIDAKLQRVRDLRPSSRALIVKISSIGIYCMAFLFALQLLGISLAAFSVLGGALGVGIGFGLQKIASNFISGIILLFEKSIEIGDMIELADGTTGYVRQTYARYTRLEAITGKEILIPNEEFITQRVISWTHSNPRAMLDVTVGVAYDTDLQLARKLMIEAVAGHDWLLPGSEINCHVANLANSSVELKLFFWVRDVSQGRAGPISDVLMAVHSAFSLNGISIPFPQREVRILNEPEAPQPPKATAKSSAKKVVEK